MSELIAAAVACVTAVAVVNYPGHMAFANKGGEYFHGCRIGHFKDIAALNEFFAPGSVGHLKLVAEILPQNDGTVLCVYTNKLSHEDMEDVEEFNRNMHSYFEEKREKRKNERLAAEQKREDEAKEAKRLAEVGRKYEARTKHVKTLEPGSLERKRQERDINSGFLDEDTK